MKLSLLEIAATATLVLIGFTFSVAGFWIWYNRDTSIYARGYSEEAFQSIGIGMEEDSVYKVMGSPLSSEEVSSPETWYYSDNLTETNRLTITVNFLEECERITFDRAGYVEGIFGKQIRRKAAIGMEKGEVLRVLGEPTEIHPQVSKILHYSSPASYGLYRARIIGIDHAGTVSEITTYDVHD